MMIDDDEANRNTLCIKYCKNYSSIQADQGFFIKTMMDWSKH